LAAWQPPFQLFAIDFHRIILPGSPWPGIGGVKGWLARDAEGVRGFPPAAAANLAHAS